MTANDIITLRHKFHNPKELFALTNKSAKDSKASLGVTCFSKLENNLLMWTHYSDSHQGVCLKFDILADTDFFMTPIHVLYEREYPKFNYIRNREGLGKFLLEIKSIDWEYEKEIRIMKQGANLYEFKKDSLIEIIFGVRTTIDDRKKIIQKVNSNSFNKVNFKKCNISNTKFELEISNH